MGSLRPGATYIYERANGIVYAREAGADPSTRTQIGETYDPRTADGRPLHDHLMEDKMWANIRRAARTNPTLQDALDHVIMIYNLTKTK